MTSREHQSSLFIFKIEVVVFDNQWSLRFEILQKVRIIPYYDKKLLIVDFFKTEDLLPVLLFFTVIYKHRGIKIDSLLESVL